MTFEDTCRVCLDNKDFVREWNRLTGHKLGETRSPIVMAIDEVCGYDPDMEAMPGFVDFVFEYIWLPLIRQHGEKA